MASRTTEQMTASTRASSAIGAGSDAEIGALTTRFAVVPGALPLAWIVVKALDRLQPAPTD